MWIKRSLLRAGSGRAACLPAQWTRTLVLFWYCALTCAPGVGGTVMKSATKALVSHPQSCKCRLLFRFLVFCRFFRVPSYTIQRTPQSCTDSLLSLSAVMARNNCKKTHSNKSDIKGKLWYFREEKLIIPCTSRFKTAIRGSCGTGVSPASSPSTHIHYCSLIISKNIPYAPTQPNLEKNSRERLCFLGIVTNTLTMSYTFRMTGSLAMA